MAVSSAAFHYDGVGLAHEKLARPVIRTIVEKHEPLDAKATVVGEECRKEIHLVPEDRQQREARRVDVGSEHDPQVVVLVAKGDMRSCQFRAVQSTHI